MTLRVAIPVTIESVDGDETDLNERELPAQREIVFYLREGTIDDAVSKIELALDRLIDPEALE